MERVDCAACLQSSTEGLFSLPGPLPAQIGADSPYPIEGPLPTLSNGEPDAEVQFACVHAAVLHVCLFHIGQVSQHCRDINAYKAVLCITLLAVFQQALCIARLHEAADGQMLLLLHCQIVDVGAVCLTALRISVSQTESESPVDCKTAYCFNRRSADSLSHQNMQCLVSNPDSECSRPLQYLLEHHMNHWLKVREHHVKKIRRKCDRYKIRLKLLLQKTHPSDIQELTQD